MSADAMFGASFWQGVLADMLLYTACFGTLGLLGLLATAIGQRRPRCGNGLALSRSSSRSDD